jgi:hypothetical protein
MSRDRLLLDEFEELDEVSSDRQPASEMKKRAYSARFDSRRPKSPLSQNGAHRRRNKRSVCC